MPNNNQFILSSDKQNPKTSKEIIIPAIETIFAHLYNIEI